MFLGWGILIPIGGFLARYRPKTIKNEKGEYVPCFMDAENVGRNFHPNLQVSGYISASAGFIIAFIMVDSHFSANNIHHAIIGTAIMALGLFQIILGILRPHPPKGYNKKEETKDKREKKGEWRKPTCGQACCCKEPEGSSFRPWRLFWERKHRWLGRTLIVAAGVNIGLGIWLLFGIERPLVVIIILYAAFCLAEIIVLIVCDAASNKGESKSGKSKSLCGKSAGFDCAKWKHVKW